jgi:hypothetical protein
MKNLLLVIACTAAMFFFVWALGYGFDRSYESRCQAGNYCDDVAKESLGIK